MALKYDTHEQANMRLGGTVITYGDKTVWVREVYMDKGQPWLHVQEFPIRQANGNSVKTPTEGYHKIRGDDPDLNFRIFRLGYINDVVHRQAMYVTRAPQRQQNQGLTRATLNGCSEDGFWTSSLPDMLFGRYPTPEQAHVMLSLEDSDRPWVSVGISRDFAISRDKDFSTVTKLFYRDQPVGISLSNSKFELEESYRFLKEVVEENHIPFKLV